MKSGFIIIEQMEVRHLKKLVLILLVVFLTACELQEEIESIIEEPMIAVEEAPIVEEVVIEEQEVVISLRGRAVVAAGLPGIQSALDELFGFQGYSIWSSYNEANMTHLEEIILLYNDILYSQVPPITFGIDELLPNEVIVQTKESGQRIVMIQVHPRTSIQSIFSQLSIEDFLNDGRRILETNNDWIQSLNNPVERVFYDIRNVFNFEFEQTHPIDFYVSPSTNESVASGIFDSIFIAAGLFEPYLTGFDPISVTILHPNDFEWYEEMVETLDLFDYGDPWFQRSSVDGGGAVFESYSGRPHMFLMYPEGRQPNLVNLDYYVHETMHIFQLGLLGGVKENRDRNLGCIYVEGGATLIGNVLSRVNEEQSLRYYIQVRQGRIGQLREFYRGEEDLFNALYDQIRYRPNDRCNVQYPGFGYNYGALLAEKMIFDFGTEMFMEMHYLMNRYTISQAFGMLFNTDYNQWLREQAVPYVLDLIKA